MNNEKTEPETLTAEERATLELVRDASCEDREDKAVGKLLRLYAAALARADRLTAALHALNLCHYSIVGTPVWGQPEPKGAITHDGLRKAIYDVFQQPPAVPMHWEAEPAPDDGCETLKLDTIRALLATQGLHIVTEAELSKRGNK